MDVGEWCSDPGIYVLSFDFVSGFGHSRSVSLGVFDFMQRHKKRSLADLKQCMPVVCPT